MTAVYPHIQRLAELIKRETRSYFKLLSHEARHCYPTLCHPLLRQRSDSLGQSKTSACAVMSIRPGPVVYG